MASDGVCSRQPGVSLAFGKMQSARIVFHCSFVRDAAGPDRIEFGELVDYLVSLTGRTRVVRLPIPACALLYRLASGLMRETILTIDELKGLSRNRLDSAEEPLGRIGLRKWLRDNVSTIGSRFLREPRR